MTSLVVISAGLSNPSSTRLLADGLTSDTVEALGEGVWTTEAIEAALRAALIDGMGLKPRVAFGPLRVAVSGRRVSPPLFESMELLGRAETLARLAKLTDRLGPAPAEGER